MKTPKPRILNVLVPEVKELPAFRACIVKVFENRYREIGEHLILGNCPQTTNTYKTLGRLIGMGVPKVGVYIGRLYKCPLETYKGYSSVYFAVRNGVLVEVDNDIKYIYEALES